MKKRLLSILLCLSMVFGIAVPTMTPQADAVIGAVIGTGLKMCTSIVNGCIKACKNDADKGAGKGVLAMFKYAAADFTGIDFGGSSGGSTQETVIQKVDLSQVEAELKSINSQLEKNNAAIYQLQSTVSNGLRSLSQQMEGLSQQTGLLFGEVPDRVEMQENGVRFLVDVKEGQKTGFFLDQKENRAAIAPFVSGMRVLDCFTHTGSFALHAAHYGAAEVTGVDISEHACACALENARLNGVEDRVRFECANAFDFLRAHQTAKEQYDVVILDPPAFTKTRSAVEGALRGYKEINLRGMKLTRDGGFFITCSCSQHVTPDLFRGMLLEAQKDAHVQLRQIEWRTQGRDHPILLASPETQYLKCGIFQVFK